MKTIDQVIANNPKYFSAENHKFFGTSNGNFDVLELNGETYLYLIPNKIANMFGTRKMIGREHFHCLLIDENLQTNYIGNDELIQQVYDAVPVQHKYGVK